MADEQAQPMQETFLDGEGFAFDAPRDREHAAELERRRVRREKRLTEKQLCFVEEYLVDFNATQAAIRAGYSEDTAYSIGSENLRKPEIMAELAERQGRRMERLEISADRVQQDLAKLAHYDPRRFFHANGAPKAIHELDDHTASALAGFEVTQVFEGRGAARKAAALTFKIKLADKGRNLERLGRILGMFNDVPVVANEMEIAVLTVDM